ncbi:MAG: DUF2344 domain-containing protein, partial [Acidimicrobiales bacterium]|nr:DUF2344 domain-containing protein [Acidimicrobiales bacterium]
MTDTGTSTSPVAATDSVVDAVAATDTGTDPVVERAKIPPRGPAPRVRIRFSKHGKVRFTSHRDVARIW